MWISIEAVPNSRPLSRYYQIWHMTALGLDINFSLGIGLKDGYCLVLLGSILLEFLFKIFWEDLVGFGFSLCILLNLITKPAL